MIELSDGRRFLGNITDYAMAGFNFVAITTLKRDGSIAERDLVAPNLIARIREMTREDVLANASAVPDIAKIQQACATYFNMSMEDFLSRKRDTKRVEARFTAMFLARECGYVFEQITFAFKKVDCHTAMYGVNRIKNWLSIPDRRITKAVTDLRSQLGMQSTAHVQPALQTEIHN